MIRMLMRGTALAALTLPLFAVSADAQIAVSANDNKIALVDGVNTVPANPPPDTVTILDIGVSPPKVLGELQAPNSVVGVPQSVAVSKDETFALVTWIVYLVIVHIRVVKPNVKADTTGDRTVTRHASERLIRRRDQAPRKGDPLRLVAVEE